MELRWLAPIDLEYRTHTNKVLGSSAGRVHTLVGGEGGATPGGDTVVWTFTIQNAGTAPLNLTGSPIVELSGPCAADFAVTQQPVSPVPAGGTTTFQGERPIRNVPRVSSSPRRYIGATIFPGADGKYLACERRSSWWKMTSSWSSCSGSILSRRALLSVPLPMAFASWFAGPPPIAHGPPASPRSLHASFGGGLRVDAIKCEPRARTDVRVIERFDQCGHCKFGFVSGSSKCDNRIYSDGAVWVMQNIRQQGYNLVGFSTDIAQTPNCVGATIQANALVL